LVPRQAAILESRHFFRGFKQEFTRQLELLSWDETACWRRREEICDEGKDKQFASDIDMPLAEDIAPTGIRTVSRAFHESFLR
jgi:hypothetical protein